MAKTYKRLDGETDCELIFRICKEKDLIGSWQDVADILNELTGNNYTESKYRKSFQEFQRVFSANQNHFTNDNQVNEIRRLERKLEQAKIQYRDERNAWNKQNYTAARVSQKLDYLEKALTSIGMEKFEPQKVLKHSGTDEMIVCLSDLHIGEAFDNKLAKYNSTIAENRLEQYLSNIIEQISIYHPGKIHVCCVGDLINGNIHKTIQVTNRENVIDQIKIATELISNFCYELTKYSNVYFYNVSGNHTRLDRKDDALKDERLDDIIGWAVGLNLKHIKNFKYINNNIDTGICVFNVAGLDYVAVHGDYDSPTSQGVSALSMMVNTVPYAILRGHLHTVKMDEISGVIIVQGGSLAGAGNDYTIQKRMIGKPSQAVCICNEKGIKAFMPIVLD